MNNRYYCVEIVLYTDNKSHLLLLNDLIKKYDYAYILHNMDREDNGDLKKAHFHLLLFFKNARWGTAILNEIKIDNPNLIEFRDNKVNAIKYLVHSNNLDKFQYDYKEIISNIDLEIYFSNLNNKEEQDICVLYDFIDNYKGLIKYRIIYNYVLSNNLWSSYRRNYSIIKDLINEHNSDLNL